MKWQIKGDGVEYADPDSASLWITEGILKNVAKTAAKIFEGENKTVCAWIECKNVKVIAPDHHPDQEWEPIYYNPRIAPHWRDAEGKNIDKQMYRAILSCGKNLYAKS